MEEDRIMAVDFRNDVNRALAACGASPMPYRDFGDVSRAARDPSPTTPSIHEFGLLLDALPDVGQIPLAGATFEQATAPTSKDSSSEPATSERMNLFRPMPTQGFKSDVSTAKPIAIPLGDAQTSRKTLSNVFRTLSDAGPMRGKRVASSSGLQDIFSRF
jgi:hypothetical protein